MGGRGARSSQEAKEKALMDAYAKSIQPIPVDDTGVASDFSVNYNEFMAMTDDEKIDFIYECCSHGVPVHLAQNDFQRFIYHSGLNEKPDVVDDATLDKMTGAEMFRTVNDVKDQKNDISYDANQIAKQVMAGSVTRVSDTGGSAYGRGIYFASSYSESTGTYGDTVGNVKKTAVTRAKLNNNAKVISFYDARNGYAWESRHETKLGMLLRKLDTPSAVSVYAMVKGYNVIAETFADGSSYYNVLNRNAITMSKSIKPAGSSW